MEWKKLIRIYGPKKSSKVVKSTVSEEDESRPVKDRGVREFVLPPLSEWNTIEIRGEYRNASSSPGRKPSDSDGDWFYLSDDSRDKLIEFQHKILQSATDTVIEKYTKYLDPRTVRDSFKMKCADGVNEVRFPRDRECSFMRSDGSITRSTDLSNCEVVFTLNFVGFYILHDCSYLKMKLVGVREVSPYMDDPEFTHRQRARELVNKIQYESMKHRQRANHIIHICNQLDQEITINVLDRPSRPILDTCALLEDINDELKTGCYDTVNERLKTFLCI